MNSRYIYGAWPARRPCPVCAAVTVVRPNGLFRAHPVKEPRCAGSGTAAPALPTGGTLRGQRVAYLNLILKLIERHGYQPQLCDRAERTLLDLACR